MRSYRRNNRAGTLKRSVVVTSQIQRDNTSNSRGSKAVLECSCESRYKNFSFGL